MSADNKSIKDILLELKIQDWDVLNYTIENSSQYNRYGYASPYQAKLYLGIFKGPKAIEKEKRYAEYLKLKQEFEPDARS